MIIAKTIGKKLLLLFVVAFFLFCFNPAATELNSSGRLILNSMMEIPFAAQYLNR